MIKKFFVFMILVCVFIPSTIGFCMPNDDITEFVSSGGAFHIFGKNTNLSIDSWSSVKYNYPRLVDNEDDYYSDDSSIACKCWNVERLNNGYYTIESLSEVNNLALTVDTKTNKVFLYPNGNYKNQQWKFVYYSKSYKIISKYNNAYLTRNNGKGIIYVDTNILNNFRQLWILGVS
jgi:hypothetical protein